MNQSTIFTAGIVEALRLHGRASIPGFGLFDIYDREPRNIRNPSNGQLMRLPGMRSIRFKPFKALKLAVLTHHVGPETPGEELELAMVRP